MDLIAQDVNSGQGSSPDSGVKQGSPPSQDVNAPDPSTGDVQQSQAAQVPEKPHEDSVPYERFQEINRKLAETQAQLESFQNPAQPAQPDTSQGEQSPWGFDTDQQIQNQQQQPLSWDQIEERVSQDMFTKPVQTMTPIVQEIVQNYITAQRQQESRVRGIPDFSQYERDFYSVPEDLVAQAQRDPTLVKFLLAKHKSTLANRQGQPQQSQQFQQSQQPNPPAKPKDGTFLESQASQPQPGNGSEDPMEKLREQYRLEGEKRALENLKRTQGMTSEGTASPSAPSGENVELDDAGKSFMRSLGIPDDQMGEVAGRVDQLEKFVKGE